MTKKDAVDFISKYYAYHRTSNKSIRRFNLSNEIETVGGRVIVGYGVYFNFDKKLYSSKGKYIYVCVLNVRNPFITDNQVYSSLITRDKKSDLYSKGYDSVILVRKGNIEEVICFRNSQIKIQEILKT